jgi:hypothetical protein
MGGSSSQPEGETTLSTSTGEAQAGQLRSRPELTAPQNGQV